MYLILGLYGGVRHEIPTRRCAGLASSTLGQLLGPPFLNQMPVAATSRPSSFDMLAAYAEAHADALDRTAEERGAPWSPRLSTRYLLPAHWSELREHAVLTLPPCISPNITLTLIEAHTYTHSPSQSERRARSSGSSGVVVSSLSRSVSPRWSTSRASSCRRRPPAG